MRQGWVVEVSDIIGRYVPLSDGRGVCPFCGGDSLATDDATDTWHCAGCEAGGDVISFVKRIEGVGFEMALRMVSKWCGELIDGR